MAFLTRASWMVPAALATLVAGAAADPDFVSSERTAPLAASGAHADQQPMEDIVFAKDSAVIVPETEAQLDAAASWMRAHPSYRLVLEGRADSSGTAAYNEALAARRIDKVRQRLVGSGVDTDRIVLAVYGENGAERRANPLERRVVMFASQEPRTRLVATELDRDAIQLSWSENGVVFRQSRGITPTAAPVAPVISMRGTLR